MGVGVSRAIFSFPTLDLHACPRYVVGVSCPTVFPNLEILILKSPTDDDEVKNQWEEAWNRGRGILHKVHFYRIVLDEAHVIKNHRSQTSLACRGLMAK